VRLFTPDDAEPLTALLHAAYAELGARGLNYTAVDQDAETTLVRAQGGQCWIVENQEGGIVGTLTMTYPPSAEIRALTAEAREPRRAWLNQVAVSPLEQRSGIASYLWTLGQAWACDQGATSVGVDTAVPARRLVRLYASWAFTHRDTIHWDGKTYNSVVMVRPLGPAQLESDMRIEITRPGSAMAESIVRAYTTDVASRWHGRPATSHELDRALTDEPYDDLQENTGVFLVAVENGRPIACAGARFLDGVAEITKVFTLPNHRGRGAGSQLLRFLEESCRERGAKILRLDTRAELTEACALYERLGFTRVAAFNDEPYSDRWYAKDLSAPVR
jgi:GNAT superfamily N-acetyltransferase